jgi:hypothetical protein
VACPTSTSCVAVGAGSSGGVVVPVTADGIPGQASTVPGTSELVGVACPTSTSCVAVGDNGSNTNPHGMGTTPTAGRWPPGHCHRGSPSARAAPSRARPSRRGLFPSRWR